MKPNIKMKKTTYIKLIICISLENEDEHGMIWSYEGIFQAYISISFDLSPFDRFSDMNG